MKLLLVVCICLLSAYGEKEKLTNTKRDTVFRIRDKVIPISLYDYTTTDSLLKSLTNEINKDVYHLHAWEPRIRKDDPDIVILDIGANIGAFSIAACKYYPEARIYAFEPLPQNYENLVKNLEINGCSRNVVAVHSGVGKSDKPVAMNAKISKNSGGASMYTKPDKSIFNVKDIPMTTLDSIIETYNITNISLLKIDCEGCEYNTLYNTKNLHMIQSLVGEWHLNSFLRSRGHTFERLDSHIRKHSPGIRMFHVDIQMRE